MTDELAKVEPKPLAVVGEPQSDAVTLIQLGIEKNIDPESMKELHRILVAERAWNAEVAFNEAKREFLSICPPVPKLGTNDQFEVTDKGTGRKRYSRFARLSDIETTIIPYAHECGLSHSWTDMKPLEVSGKHYYELGCKLAHVGGHSEISGMALPAEGRGGGNDQQKGLGVHTYLRRGTIISVYAIPCCDEDNDGNSPVANATPQEKPKTITTEQANDLNDRFIALGGFADKGRFLKGLGYEKLSDIPENRWMFCVEQLDKKLSAKIDSEKAPEPGPQNNEWVG